MLVDALVMLALLVVEDSNVVLNVIMNFAAENARGMSAECCATEHSVRNSAAGRCAVLVVRVRNAQQIVAVMRAVLFAIILIVQRPARV